MRCKYHYVVNRRDRHITAALALGFFCALFTASPLLAGWADSEYGDIFVTRQKPKPQPKRLSQNRLLLRWFGSRLHGAPDLKYQTLHPSHIVFLTQPNLSIRLSPRWEIARCLMSRLPLL